ncbi:MAG: ferredoxin [Thermodesulfobacteriota bacterium]
MEPYSRHIFICLGKRCSKKGSEQVLDAFKSRVKSEGLSGEVRLSRSGCLKACKETEREGEFSPVMVFYPEGVWYKGVTSGDVDEIFNRHVRDGEVVERLVHFRLSAG